MTLTEAVNAMTCGETVVAKTTDGAVYGYGVIVNTSSLPGSVGIETSKGTFWWRTEQVTPASAEIDPQQYERFR